MFPPTHSKRILCFSLPPNTDKERVVNYLHIAIHNTVKQVPFIAGSIVPFATKKDRRPWLRNVVPDGDLKLVIKELENEFSFSEFADSNFSQKFLNTEKLCPLPKVAYVQEEPFDACGFQANFVEGGLLLVVSIIHIIADGRGQSDVLRIFASELRRAQLGSPDQALESSKDMYSCASKTNAHAAIGDVENSCHTFHINADDLAKLKQAASPATPGSGDWISTGDALSALVWRSIMLARQHAGFLPEGSSVHIVQPVDCRSRLNLPEPYFGNVLYMNKASMSFAKIADPESGLRDAASIIRAQVKGSTAEKFQDLIGFAERTEMETHTRLGIIEDLTVGGKIFTNQFRFGAHSIDFGPLFEGGRIQAYRLPAQGTMPGAVIVLPMLRDGGCEFMLTERDVTIGYLLKDELWSQFTKS